MWSRSYWSWYVRHMQYLKCRRSMVKQRMIAGFVASWIHSNMLSTKHPVIMSIHLICLLISKIGTLYSLIFEWAKLSRTTLNFNQMLVLIMFLPVCCAHYMCFWQYLIQILISAIKQHLYPHADEDSRYVMFFCGHIYHYRCVSKKNEVGHAYYLLFIKNKITLLRIMLNYFLPTLFSGVWGMV